MGGGLEDDERDIPLAVKYETSSIWRPLQQLLGVNRTGAAIAVSLVEAHNLDRWVSYSRSRTFYDSRDCHPLLTYRRTITAVDHFDGNGLIEHFRQRPGVRGMQSCMRAGPALIEAVQGVLEVHPPLPLDLPRLGLVMRDADGKAISIPRTREVSRMSRKVAEINEGLISVDARQAAGPCLAAPVSRIFNLDLHRGGRFYTHGASWQNIKRELRKSVQINGEPVVELDYSTLHPALLYAEAGAPLPGDCYTIVGWARPLVKFAFLVLLNARNVHSARQKIAHSEEMGWPSIHEQVALQRASLLIAEIKARHPAISKAFHSDAGARLMRRDSEIAEHVLLTLNSKGIVALPMHDSFLVPVSKRWDLEEAMMEAAYRFGLREIQVGLVG